MSCILVSKYTIEQALNKTVDVEGKTHSLQQKEISLPKIKQDDDAVIYHMKGGGRIHGVLSARYSKDGDPTDSTSSKGLEFSTSDNGRSLRLFNADMGKDIEAGEAVFLTLLIGN